MRSGRAVIISSIHTQACVPVRSQKESGLLVNAINPDLAGFKAQMRLSDTNVYLFMQCSAAGASHSLQVRNRAGQWRIDVTFTWTVQTSLTAVNAAPASLFLFLVPFDVRKEDLISSRVTSDQKIRNRIEKERKKPFR